jgi:hypothetical protein
MKGKIIELPKANIFEMLERCENIATGHREMGNR